jgi:hypothetical protein
MKAFCSDRFVLPLRSGHRFSVQKYYLLSERVQAELPNVLLNEAPIAADPELARWMPASSERLAFRGRGKWWNAPGALSGRRSPRVMPLVRMVSQRIWRAQIRTSTTAWGGLR